jgi:hypothetical protein
MTEADLAPRPRQLMVAAGVVIAGSVFLVAAVFDSLANLQSVDTREQLQRVVTSSAGRNLGVSLDQVISAMRTALGVTAVCAAVAAVLGVFVLQRHRGARIGLSIVAVPLLVSAPLVGGFLGALVAVATLMLWNGPAGDWYAGRPIRESARAKRPGPDARPSPEAPAPPPVQSAPSDVLPEAPPSTRETSTAPGATHGFGLVGVPAVPPGAEIPPPSAAPPPGPATPPVTAPAGPVPVQVKMACILTWVFSGVVALLYLAAVVALLVDRQPIVDRVVESPAWHDSGLSDDMLVPMLWVGVLLFLAWSLGSIVLAWFAWRRHNWARYLLAASAVVTLLIGVVAFPVGIPHQIACALAAGGLFAPQSRAWYAGHRASAPPRPPW